VYVEITWVELGGGPRSMNDDDFPRLAHFPFRGSRRHRRKTSHRPFRSSHAFPSRDLQKTTRNSRPSPKTAAGKMTLGRTTIFLKSKENCMLRLEEISMSVGMCVGCVEVKIIS
jgi:hypothetical protein